MAIKNLLKIIVIIANIGLLQAQYSTIPDVYFEQELINQNIDSEGILDGQILTSDINTITVLDIGFSSIFSLDGIEDFVLLETLYCDYNYIETLDLSNNSNLKYLLCSENNLTTLNLNSNTLLESLNCDYNQITTLNIDNCTHLTFLNCIDNLLTNINITNITNLIHFNVAGNQISTININQNIYLESVILSHNNISELLLNNCINIKILACINNNINTLNLDSNLALEKLYCGQNNLVNLNLSNNTNIEVLNCSENNLNSLTIQNGNNNLLNGTYTIGSNTYSRFNSTNNPNLNCIFVDDAINSATNWLDVDETSTFVETQSECDALAVSNFKIDRNITVYPNPTQKYFFLSSNNSIVKIKIYTVFGKLVKTFKHQNKYLVNDLEKGIYIIKVETKEFNSTVKLIIE